MVAVGELVRFPSNRSVLAPPIRCPRGHLMRPERMLVGSTECSCGRHLTWRCHCGAVTYRPELGEKCILPRRPAVPAGITRFAELDQRRPNRSEDCSSQVARDARGG